MYLSLTMAKWLYQCLNPAAQFKGRLYINTGIEAGNSITVVSIQNIKKLSQVTHVYTHNIKSKK